MPFTGTCTALGGLCRKMPFRLSKTRKAGVRERLRQVETNVQELQKAELPIASLERLKLVPMYAHLSPLERYTYWSTRTRDRRPIQFLPKFTRIDAPTFVRHHYEYLEHVNKPK
jgi:Mitochondrial ribosomal protein L31